MKMCLVMILVKKVFIFSKTMIICLLCPLLCGLFFFWKGAKGELSYKVKKDRVLNDLKLCLFLSNSERAGIRTPDNLIKSQVLYHLSYTPLTGVAGLEPAVQESESCALPLGDTPSMRQLVYIIICFRQLSTLFLNFFKFIFQE